MEIGMQQLIARLSMIAEELRSEGNVELAARVAAAIEAMRHADPPRNFPVNVPGDARAPGRKPDA